MIRVRSLVLVSCLVVLPIEASDFFAAPSGTSSADGSRAKPWDLPTALAQPPAVKPGDTIWLRGGTYLGHFTSTLRGSTKKPIVVRQYAGERATIDGNDGGNAVTLLIRGSDAWYRGFEVTNSSATRTSSSADNPTTRGEGVNLLGPRTRLINVVIHDTAQGVITGTDYPDTEISGCLIYYNGYDGPDRGHGHGVYVQNAAPSTKLVLDNIIFDQFGYGIHAYTESGKLDNLDLEGNVSFNNGVLSHVSGVSTAILLGANGSPASGPNDSTKVAKNAILKHNYVYSSSASGTAVNLGYSKGIASPTIVDNYFVGGTALALVNAFRPITMTGNTFYGSISGFQSSEFPNNTYYTSRPAGVKVFVRQNRYEPGRTNITIYNWDRVPSLDVDVHGAIMVGTHYELRNAQNFFGPPVLSGIYDGSPLHVPMTPLTPATPVGWPTPTPTGPDFQVFVLVPTAPPSDSRAAVHRPGHAGRVPVRIQRSAGASMSSSTGSPTSAVVMGQADTGSGSAANLDVSACADVAPIHGPEAPSRAHSPAESMLAAVRYFPQAATSRSLPECRTSLSITNRGPDPSTITLSFLEHDRGDGPAPTTSFILGAGETVAAFDSLATFFGLSDTYGAIELQTDSPAQISAFARSMPGGAMGGRADGGFTPDDLTSTGTLHGLDQSAGGTADLLFVNPGVGSAIVSLTLLDSSERSLETTFVAVPARSSLRRSLDSLFPAAASDQDLLSIAFDAGIAPVLVLASAHDHRQPQEPVQPAER